MGKGHWTMDGHKLSHILEGFSVSGKALAFRK